MNRKNSYNASKRLGGLSAKTLWLILGVSFVAVTVLSVRMLFGRAHFFRAPNDPAFQSIVETFRSGEPVAMNISPDGNYFLTRGEEQKGVKVGVVDLAHKQEVTSISSEYMKRSLTWSPDSKFVAYQEFVGMDRPVWIFNIETGEKQRLGAFVSQTALPPIRWNNSGKKIACFDGDRRKGRLLVVDLSQPDDPMVIHTGLSTDCDFVWSPDGSQIAFSSDTEGVVYVATLRNLETAEYQVAEGLDGSVHQLAWSPDGKHILASARGAGDQFYKVFDILTENGSISVAATADGDIMRPVWLPDSRGWIYHINRNGIITAFLRRVSDATPQPIGPTNGVVQILHADPEGKYLYAHFSGLTSSPVLGRISISKNDWEVVYSSPNANKYTCPEARFITFPSANSVAVPAYHWVATTNSGAERSVLIVSHGGEHTQTFPTWEAYISLMTSLGCDVIAPNHRRSSGYGRDYEYLSGDASDDVSAACRYAVDVLGIKPNRVFLIGLSTGSRLIAEAAGRGGEFGGIFVISWPGQKTVIEPNFTHVFPVFSFHGELDSVLSPDQAHASIEKFFNNGAEPRFHIQYQVYKGEPHFFYRSESLASIYWEVAKQIQRPN